MPKSCKRGQIRRDGHSRRSFRRRSYRRRDGTLVRAARVSRTRVAPTCVEDRGRPGKGPKVIPRVKNPGDLKKHGYNLDRPADERRKALRSAKREKGYSSLISKLTALATLHKNTNPDIAKKLRADMRWLRLEYRGSRRKN